MENTKALCQSTTVQGAVVSLLGFIVSFFKLPIATEEIGQVISALAVLIGFGMTIYGRLRAREQIVGFWK